MRFPIGMAEREAWYRHVATAVKAAGRSDEDELTVLRYLAATSIQSGQPALTTRLADQTARPPPPGRLPKCRAAPPAAAHKWRTGAWLVVGAALPAASSAALMSLRGTVPNTDIALLITGAVLVVATSGRRSATAIAALSAAVSFD